MICAPFLPVFSGSLKPETAQAFVSQNDSDTIDIYHYHLDVAEMCGLGCGSFQAARRAGADGYSLLSPQRTQPPSNIKGLTLLLCRLNGKCRDEKQHRINETQKSRRKNHYAMLECLADYPCNQQFIWEHNQVHLAKQAILNYEELLKSLNVGGVV